MGKNILSVLFLSVVVTFGLAPTLAFANSTLTLHPSGAAAGDEMKLYSGGSAANALDSNDGNSSYGDLDKNSADEARLDLDNHTSETGTIVSVQIKSVQKDGTGDAGDKTRLGLKTNGTEYWGSQISNVPTSYTAYSGSLYTINPNTTVPWTWTEIDSLVAQVDNFVDGAADYWITELYAEVIYNVSPTLTVDEPDGTGDTVTVGDNYSIQYDLADSDDVVTIAFYHDTNNTGLDGTAITGACATAAEGTTVTCTWDTTGMTPGTYYVYGKTNDGTNPEVTDYSPGQITINALTTTIDISGTCKQSDESTDCTDNGKVSVAVNSTLQAQEQLNYTGTWTIFGLTASSGDVITVFIDDGAGNVNEAVAVTKYDGSGNITGVELIEEHLTLGSDDLQTLTNTDLSQYDNTLGGENVFHDVDNATNDLTVDFTAQFSAEELYIKSGNTYQPDSGSSGNVTTHDLEINGTFIADGNTLTLTGSWDNNSVFTANTSTVNFTATSGTELIDSTGATTADFYNITFNDGGGSATYRFESALVVSNDLTATDGILDTKSGSNYAITVTRDFTQVSGLVQAQTSTITVGRDFTADGTQSPAGFNNASLVLTGTGGLTYNNLSVAWFNGFNNLTLGQSGNTTTLNNTLTVQNVLTVGSGTFTSAGAQDVFLLAVNPLSFDANATLSIRSLRFFQGSQNIPALTNGYDTDIYVAGGPNTVTQTGNIVINTGHHLRVQGDGFANRVSTYVTAGFDLTVAGDIQVGAGNDTGLKTLNGTNSNITVGGNFDVRDVGAGTQQAIFTSTNSTVTLNGTADQTLTSSGSNFNHLTLNNTGTAGNDDVIIADALDVNGTLTITDGNLDAATNSADITLAGNWTRGVSGAFTPGTNTLTLDGGNQTISGSTTFNNLTKTESTNDATDVILTFDNTAIQTINGTFTLDGLDADDRINLVSDSPGTQWSLVLGASATKAIDFVDVTDSDASGSDASQKPINPTSGVDSGNNIAWFSTFAVTGTVYQDDRSTPVVGDTVRLIINGTDSALTGVTNGSGIYSISATLNSGDAVLAYVDGGSIDGNTVTITDGVTLNGLDIYATDVTTRHDNSGSLTNANMNTALGAFSDAGDILYSVSGGNLTVNAGTELFIPASHSFTPGGNVTTPSMESLGTFNGGSGAIDINGALSIGGGSFTATSGTTFVSDNLTISGGTFIHNSGTFSLEPNNKTVNTGAAIFNHVIVNMFNGETLTVTGTMDVNGNLSILGVAAINGTLAVSGNVTTTTFVSGSGIILLDGNSNQTLGASGGVGGVPGLTINNTGAPGAVVTIQDTIDIGGGGAWTYTAGNVNASTSTIRFREFSKTISSAGMSFNDVEFNISSGSTVTNTGTMGINGNLTFTEQSAINGGGINLAGNLTSTDISVNGTTTLTLDGTGTQTINTAGADLPDGLFTINKVSGTAQLISAMTTALDGAGQDLTITQGTLDLNGFNLTVPDVLTVSASGTLQLEGGETVTRTTATLNAGSTVLHDGGGSYTGLPLGPSYSNVSFDNATGTWTLGMQLFVNNNLTITNGTLDVSASNYSVNVAGNWSNIGTFTARSGTVVFDGTNQTITGSTTFNNFSKTESTNDAADVILTFDNTGTQTINGTFTLNGLDSDDRINLVSDSPGTQWSLVLGASATKAIDFVDVTDSDASGSDAGQKPINPTSGVDSGNNIAWFSTFSVSGTVYQDDRSTPVVGDTVRLIVNGTDSGLTGVTNGSGIYSISATLNSGDAVLAYVDGGSIDGNTVTITDGVTLNGLDIYATDVTTRHDNSGSLTNANMNTALGAFSDAGDILYSVSGGNLTVNAGTELFIPASHSFTPGGNVTTPSMESLGTFDGGSGSITINGTLTQSGGSFTATSGTTTISGNFTISAGTFIHNSGLITFNNVGGKTVDIGAADLNNVTMAATATTDVAVTGTMNVTGNLTITTMRDLTAGTIAVTGSVLTTDTSVGGVGVILFTGSGTQTLSASGGSGALPGVSINKAGGSLTIQDTIEIDGGSGWIYTAGTVVTTGSTIAFQLGGKTVNSGSMVFNDVSIALGGNSLTVTGTMDVDGNLTVTSVNNIDTGTIAVTGNVTTTDADVNGTGRILFDGGGAQTLQVDGIGGTGGVPAVQINKGGGTLSIRDTIAVGGFSGIEEWEHIAGTVDANTSTIIFDFGTKTITPGTMSFDNITLTMGGNGLTVTAGTLDINGNLTITTASGINGPLTLAGNLSSTDASVNGTGTITLDGTGAQTIDTAGADLPDGLFTINKTSGTAQLISAMTTALDGAGQDLTLTQGTLDLNGFDLTVPDVLTVDTNGILQLEGSETLTTTTTTLNTGSTVLYDGAGAYANLVVGDTYSNLMFNGTGTWTLDAALDVNSNLTITNGNLDVSASNYSVNVAGNWSNAGNFTARAGTVVFDGTNQSISGSTTFNNFSKTESTNDAADVILTFDNTGTQTINGTFTLDGLDADDRINLVSDSPGTQWSLVLGASATKAIDFVDVTDSDASGSDASQKPVNPTSSINSGNNLDWFNTCPTVTITADAGDGSLHDCITYANSNPGSTISFNIPNTDPGYIDNAGDDWWRISPTSALPSITGANTVIDGSTQTSNQGNTNTLGPEIEIDGTSAGSSNGIIINNAVNTTLRDVVINNFTLHGVSVTGLSATGATLYGNYIGIDPTATGNAQNDGSGVSIDSANAVIGGTAAGEGNLVAFNFERGFLISINGTNTKIIGNEIREQGYSGIVSLASGVEISKNLIRNNSTRTNFDEVAISTNNIVTNNTIHGAAGDGLSVEGANAIIKNNIITGSAGYGIRIDGGSMTEDYNDVPASPTSNGNALGSCFGCGGLGPNSIVSDPAYVNVGANNFNLTEPSSPAIEVGCDLGNAGNDTACDSASDGAQPDLNGATSGNFNGVAPDMGAFESNTSILPLVKVLFQGDTCLASSDADATCNGGVTSISVPTGVVYTFVIYVANPTGSAATDIRFQDNIDDTAADYFEFQPNGFAAGQGVQWASTGSGTSTKAQIKTALNAGTPLTNAFDGSTGTNEYCGINTGVSPDQLICGGDAVSPNNDQINVAAGNTVAIMFNFIKRD